MSAHEQWADTAGAYVLGALDDHEREAFEAHMSGCATCRGEVEQLRVAADSLPAGVPQFAPPPALKDRIMAIVNAEAELLAAAGRDADRPPAPAPAQRRAPRPLLAWLSRPAVALACALALIVAGVGAGVLLSGGDDTHTVVADTQAPGAQVELRVSDDSATLVARHMPPPPSGRIYQVWLKRPGQDPQPTSVLWSVDAAGSADVAVPGTMEGVESVLVTDEPEGGSRTPTRPPVISARIA
jgi:anti-sigma-K factor RskA